MEQRTDIVNPFDPDYSLQQNMDITFDNILEDFPLPNPTAPAHQALPPAQPILTTPHVLEETKEAPLPKKRGRKPGSGRKPAAAPVKSEPMETDQEPKEKKARKPRVAKAAPKKKAAKKQDDDSIFDDSDDEMNDDENLGGKDEKTKKLLKNREAAQQFRQRQRDHIDVLEKQVQQLIEQRAQYNTQTDALLAENKLVRGQVQYMREFLSQALAFAFSQNVSRMYPMANTNIKTVDPAQN
eukprot:TRINITY_DN3375_c0_g1_i1.p1 TRINITY_DN3375_c0_g1~~TRINITY_DN3375_c0_g1_i1.p1  ORF type:complete len:279 (+),score=42.72 TRINITY_DN3375_c0_g1_i1:119-838(+)